MLWPWHLTLKFNQHLSLMVIISCKILKFAIQLILGLNFLIEWYNLDLYCKKQSSSFHRGIKYYKLQDLQFASCLLLERQTIRVWQYEYHAIIHPIFHTYIKRLWWPIYLITLLVSTLIINILSDNETN
jgi:hypothetical protein